MDFSDMNQLMNQSMDQPINLLTKNKTDGTQVIRKLFRDETRQMEMFKKMSKQERRMFGVKHVKCLHRCVPNILRINMKGCDCEDCDIRCVFQKRNLLPHLS